MSSRNIHWRYVLRSIKLKSGRSSSGCNLDVSQNFVLETISVDRVVIPILDINYIVSQQFSTEHQWNTFQWENYYNFLIFSRNRISIKTEGCSYFSKTKSCFQQRIVFQHKVATGLFHYLYFPILRKDFISNICSIIKMFDSQYFVIFLLDLYIMCIAL